MLIQSAIDTLDMGEMDAFTLQETVQVLSESAASFGNPFTLYLHLGEMEIWGFMGGGSHGKRFGDVFMLFFDWVPRKMKKHLL